MATVVVLGAGVSGLTSALCLLQLYGKRIKKLVVVASEFPGDYHSHTYASPWAGANWMSFASEEDLDQIRRDKSSYTRLMQLADEPAAGIKKYRAKVILSKDEKLPWFITQSFAEDIATLSEEELEARQLDPRKFQGYEYTTFTLSPSVYNHFLIAKIKQLGGTIKKVPPLQAIEDLAGVLKFDFDLVINCTAVNAGKLLRNVDPEEAKKVYPLKGQILQIYEDLPFQIVIDDIPPEDRPLADQFLNIFPRPDGGCIIGGFARKGDYSREVDQKLTESILRVVKRHVPELKTLTVYNSYTALRPGREGGVRISTSTYNLSNKKTLKVIHNYGIGGAGYQSSYGSAMEVCLNARSILGAQEISSSSKL